MEIYTLFLGKGRWGIGWPYIGFDEEGLADSILERLRDRFPDVEFTGGRVVSSFDSRDLQLIKMGVREADGLLLCIIGNYGTNPWIDSVGVEAIRVGRPTILASYMYAGDWGFIRIYERVRGKGFPVLPISSSDFGRVEWAVDIMRKLYMMRGRRILIITFDEVEVARRDEDRRRLIRDLLENELKVLGDEAKEGLMNLLSQDKILVDVHGVDQAIQWRRNEERYRENLRKIFGLEMVRRKPEELTEYYENVDLGEAERLAEAWIREAERVDASHGAVVCAARLYLALKKFLRDTDCHGVGIECCPVIVSGRIPAFPCMAFSKLNDEGIVAACEADMDSAVTLFLGKYVANRPGMMSNYCLDLHKGQVTYLHCTSPTKLYGYEEAPLKYYITRHGEAHFLGASPVVRFPVGEDVTTVKVSVFHGKLSIRYGRSLGLVEDEKACRDKLQVETNAQRILEKHDQSVFGWHKVSFLGDFREEFKAAAKLLGLEVVEEDR